MADIRAAVIGVGKMGRHHARIYSSIPGVKLVAVSDSDAETARKVSLEFPCKAYSDYREMLKIEKPDIVSVAVPTSLHKEVSIAALKAGSHVLVEKPIASDMKSAEEMISEAKRAKKLLAVGHVERFNPAVIEMKRIIDSGEIGTILSLISRRVGVYPPRIRDASVIVDLAVHDIDLLNYFFGASPDKIFSNGGRSILTDREDYAEIFLKYGKSTGIVQVNWITPVKVRGLIVTGSAGYAEVNYITQEIKIYKPSAKTITEYATFEEFVAAFSKVNERLVQAPKAEPLSLELAHFVECVRKGEEPLISAKAGLDALIIAKEAESQIQP